MNDAMQIENQILNMKNIAELFNTYLLRLEYTNFSGSHPYETEQIIKAIKYVNTSKPSNLFQSVLKQISLEICFKFYILFKTTYTKLEKIYEIFHKYPIEHVSSSSSSSSSSSHNYELLLETYEKMSLEWNIIQIYNNTMTTENYLTDRINTEIFGNELSIDTLKQIKKFYDDSPIVIDLYSCILRRVLDNKPEHHIVIYINKLVEQLKDEVLPPITRQTSNRKPTLQTLIQRYRLIPDGPSRPFVDLIYELTNVKVDGKNILDDLQKVSKLISKTSKYGFIVISKRLPRPIENNIWLLTDANYLQKKKLMTGLNAGICDAIIQKSKTISFLESSKGGLTDGIYYVDDILDFSNKKTSEKPEDNNFYYILETLDGVTYRILHPWYFSIFAKEKQYAIPTTMIEGFSNEKNFTKTMPSTRVESYNEILNNEIMKNLKKPIIGTVDISRYEKQQIETKWSVMRKKIAIHMLDDYRVLFDNNKVSKETILGLILNPTIYANAIKYIISLGLSDTTNESEIYMSALKQIDTMKHKMAKDVGKIYRQDYEDKIMKLLENGSNVQTIIKIIDVLEDILITMLEAHITSKNNIYLAIEQKATLLDAIKSK